jgi:hypothetical protein
MSFLAWLEASSVSTWINQSDSIFAYPFILLVHTIGLTLLVSINVAIDLRILGFAPQVPVLEMQKLFPVMWIGLVLSAISGALLLTAKATTMAVNPAFYVKMASIVIAVYVVVALRARVFRSPASAVGNTGQGTGKALAVASIALWMTAITAGRVMAYIGEAAQFG